MGVFHGILQNFRTATFENNLWGMYMKLKQRRKRARSDPCGFRFSLLPGQLFTSHETIFLHEFSHSGAFHFTLCYPF